MDAPTHPVTFEFAVRQVQPSHLDWLEAESIHVPRGVAAEFERPVLLFSRGKGSPCTLCVTEKAFHPTVILFPLLRMDTVHNNRARDRR